MRYLLLSFLVIGLFLNFSSLASAQASPTLNLSITPTNPRVGANVSVTQEVMAYTDYPHHGSVNCSVDARFRGFDGWRVVGVPFGGSYVRNVRTLTAPNTPHYTYPFAYVCFTTSSTPWGSRTFYSNQVNVTVRPLLATCNLLVNNSTLQVGQSATFSWRSANTAGEATIRHAGLGINWTVDPRNTSGTRSYTFSSAGTYSLTMLVQNSAGEQSSCTRTVTVTNAPSATISATGCTISAGQSTCTGRVTWSISNATTPNVRNSTTNTSYSSAAVGTNVAATMRYGANTIQARNSTTVLASANANATCATGTTWSGTSCATIPVPTASISANNCTISAGNSTCSTALTWSSSNTLAPFSMRQGGAQISTAANGSQNRTVTYGTNNFTFHHNTGVQLAARAVTATCATGTTWSGTTCATIPAATASISANNCTISAGNTGCNTTVTWSSSNALAPFSMRQGGVAISTAANGSQNRTITYGSNTFTFHHNNGVQLAARAVTATCAAGTSWVPATGCVTVVSGPPILSADPRFVRAGGESSITWDLQGNTGCTYRDRAGVIQTAAPAGSVNITNITNRYRFDLTCTSGQNSSIYIEVVPSIYES